MRLPSLLPAAAVLALVGCDGSDPAPRSCALYDTCQFEQPLRLTPLNVEAESPANVEVLFQVQTAAREPISNLTASDFEIYEDGDRIPEFEAGAQIQPRSERFRSATVLLLDLSASVTQSGNLEPLKAAATSFARTVLPPIEDLESGQAEVAVFWFDGNADIRQLAGFTRDPDAVAEAIASITPAISNDNSTNLYGAVVEGVEVVQDKVDALQAESIIAVGSLVTFTDGRDTAGRLGTNGLSRAVSAVDAASSEQVNGLSIFNGFTIGLGGDVNADALAELGPALYAQAGNTAELEARFREIADRVEAEANSFYVLEYCSPKRAGSHTLGIRVEARGSAGFLEERFDASSFTGGCTVD
jgi:hypothetical protein